MEKIEKSFYEIVRKRSQENCESFALLYENKLYGQCVSILRQELDSYIRVIFLRNNPKKDIFIKQTLNNEQWKDGKTKITDRYMLENSTCTKMDYWERDYIYDMGCFFIHLSNFHDYKTKNPFNSVSEQDKINVIKFIKDKHGWEKDTSELDINNIETIIPFLPLVMKKISENLQCAIENK